MYCRDLGAIQQDLRTTDRILLIYDLIEELLLPLLKRPIVLIHVALTLVEVLASIIF